MLRTLILFFLQKLSLASILLQNLPVWRIPTFFTLILIVILDHESHITHRIQFYYCEHNPSDAKVEDARNFTPELDITN